MTAAQLSNLAMTGTAGNDTLTLWSDGNFADGGAGDDTINSYGSGTNLLKGGAGNDTINFKYNSTNTIEGGSGDDLIKIDTYYASNLNYGNTFSGGTGNDRIEAGGGADTYLFNRGDGQDTINDYGINQGYGTPGSDKIVFGTGIALSDLTASRVGDHLVLKINDPANPGATDQITIENWNNAGYRIEKVQFADGSEITALQLSNLAMTGTAGNDTITLWTDGTFADGGAGDDIITDQGAGTNVLRGGSGNDMITFSSNSTNTIEGGSGDDLIKIDTYYTSNLDYGNTFSGGTGNDRIEAGGGADTYLFNRGDGQDTINDFGINWGYGSVGTDKIVFGTGIALSDLTASRVGDHLVLKINDPANPGATDQITIENWFSNSGYQIENFSFNNGTTLTANQLLAQLPVQSIGTTGNDTLSGYDGVDHMDGGAGNDTLLAYAGNDRLNGNLGNDVLTGGAGNDTFVFNTLLNAATNKDTITDFTPGQDKIELSRAIFSALPAEGTLASFAYLASPSGAAADENHHILYNTTSGALLYDADGNGQGVAIEFATLTNKPVIKADDFIIVS